jgi:hypothetical protein
MHRKLIADGRSPIVTNWHLISSPTGMGGEWMS